MPASDISESPSRHQPSEKTAYTLSGTGSGSILNAQLTECYVTTSLSPARHNLNDTGTDSDTDSEGAAEAGSEGDSDEGDHIGRYLAECYVETDACFVPASGLRSLPASHTVPGPGYGAGRSPELTGHWQLGHW